jgi:uncharacterized membrane protein YdjX (TVP38/TMEM64 family)
MPDCTESSSEEPVEVPSAPPEAGVEGRSAAFRVGTARAVTAGLILLILVLLFVNREAVIAAVRDPDRVRAWLARLGPLGPLGLIALGAAQVVIAPIPGYIVQVVGGYLFGWARGAAYGIAGMLIGGAIAMTLARIYGRPLVCRIVGDARLARWEQVTHLDSLAVWFVLMLGPFGDWVYFLAGLTTLPVWKVLAIALLVRAPSMTVVAAVGAGAISWRSPWVIGGGALLLAAGMLGARNQKRIDRWVEDHLLRRSPPPGQKGTASDEEFASIHPE